MSVKIKQPLVGVAFQKSLCLGDRLETTHTLFSNPILLDSSPKVMLFASPEQLPKYPSGCATLPGQDLTYGWQDEGSDYEQHGRHGGEGQKRW